jgi:rhodanese-related sulfurtransferase
MKIYILLIWILLTIEAKENIKSLQYSGVQTTHQGKNILVERKQYGECLNIPTTPDLLYNNSYINKKVPSTCKKTFLTSLGILQPISIDKDIKTVGELEVLAHIKKVEKEPEKYILVDARKANWYNYITIPSSINLPYDEIEYDEDFKEDFEYMLKILNIKKHKNGLDFSKAKTALIFCNGSWCVQSSKAIFKLIQLGYPKNKLLWYRGGIQDWLSYGMTTSKNP